MQIQHKDIPASCFSEKTALYFAKPLKKSEYFPQRSSQRAAGGGSAAGEQERNGLPRANRTGEIPGMRDGDDPP